MSLSFWPAVMACNIEVNSQFKCTHDQRHQDTRPWLGWGGENAASQGSFEISGRFLKEVTR